LSTPSTSTYWLSRNFTRAWAMVSLVVVMLAPCVNANPEIDRDQVWERACSRCRCTRRHRVAPIASKPAPTLDPGNPLTVSGQRGEEFMLAGQVMVKGVMHQAENIQPANRLDRIHRRAFAPQRTLLKTQRFDKAENPVLAQDRRQFAQCRAQPGVALGLCARIGTIIERAHHQSFCTAVAGI